MNVTVKARISKDWEQAIKKVQTLGGVKGVKIGIVEQATNSITDDNIAEYAFFNEFGTRRIKPRPFMRLTAQRYSKEWAGLFMQITGNRVIHDPNVARRAFEVIGQRGRMNMIDVIMSDVPPPNAVSTLARKLKKKNASQGAYIGTLYDTGEMAKSVGWKLYSRAAELQE